jgi:hypothetical protein
MLMATKKARRFAMPKPNEAPDTGLLRALDFLDLERDACREITIDENGALSIGEFHVRAYIDGRCVGTIKVVGDILIAPGDLRWSKVNTEGNGFAEMWKK